MTHAIHFFLIVASPIAIGLIVIGIAEQAAKTERHRRRHATGHRTIMPHACPHCGKGTVVTDGTTEWCGTPGCDYSRAIQERV